MQWLARVVAVSRSVRAHEELGDRLDAHRRELLAHCYRMLGSPVGAQDAVQEALARAWRRADQYDAERGSLRTWLHAIATNVCLDLLRGRQRRARAMELPPPAQLGDALGEALQPERWVEPLPDDLVAPPDADPARIVTTRESVRLAFVAALQYLPPRQRAVLLLREVLGFSAAEVAASLDTTAAAVNSALQRARGTLAGIGPEDANAADPSDPEQRRLLARYVTAFEQQDFDTLVALLRKDATLAMPPLLWWLRGRDQIASVWQADPSACAGTRLFPTVASGHPAFAQYVWSESVAPHAPRSLTVLELADGRILGLTLYLDTHVWFPRFGFPTDGLPGPRPG